MTDIFDEQAQNRLKKSLQPERCDSATPLRIQGRLCRWQPRRIESGCGINFCAGRGVTAKAAP